MAAAHWLVRRHPVPAMAKKFPIHPAHPERTCWGCDKYCPSTDLICGNGSERTQHPVELFGEDWAAWEPPTADEGSVPQSLSGAPSGKNAR